MVEGNSKAGSFLPCPRYLACISNHFITSLPYKRLRFTCYILISFNISIVCSTLTAICWHLGIIGVWWPLGINPASETVCYFTPWDRMGCGRLSLPQGLATSLYCWHIWKVSTNWWNIVLTIHSQTLHFLLYITFLQLLQHSGECSIQFDSSAG